MRAGHHARWGHGSARARPQRLRRSAGAPFFRWHDGAGAWRHSAGAVALGHGADAGLRRDRCAGETVGAWTELRLPALLGCGQLVAVRPENGVKKIVNIEGNPDSPINAGTLCPKGAAAFQLVVNKNRVTNVWYRRPFGTDWEKTRSG